MIWGTENPRKFCKKLLTIYAFHLLHYLRHLSSHHLFSAKLWKVADLSICCCPLLKRIALAIPYPHSTNLAVLQNFIRLVGFKTASRRCIETSCTCN